MNDLKRVTPKKILWLDLEMTGLDETNNRIVEVAAIITDWDFNELAVFESGIHHDSDLLKRLFKANPWTASFGENTKALLELSSKSPAQNKVEAELLALVEAHFKADQPALLAGNSIHTDRRFIKKWFPNLEARLHYRMLDVSAWKVVMQGRYDQEFTKKEAHRALDDIRESIAELKFYLQKLC